MADHGIKIWNENLQGSNLTTWPETPYYAAGEYLTADKMNAALRNATIGVKVFYDAINDEVKDSAINLGKLNYNLSATGNDYTNCVTAVKNALTSKISGLNATSTQRGTVKLGYTFDKNNKYLYPVTSVDDGTNIAVDLSKDKGIINSLESIINAATPAKTANVLVKRDASGMVWCDVTGNLIGNVTGNLTGNADTATQLAEPRTIYIDLESDEAVSFDGGENVMPGVTGVLSVANGGTGQSNLNNVVVGKADKLTTARNIQIDLGSTSIKSFDGTADVNPGVTGVLNVINGGTGQSNLNNVTVGKANEVTDKIKGMNISDIFQYSSGNITTQVKSAYYADSANSACTADYAILKDYTFKTEEGDKSDYQFLINTSGKLYIKDAIENTKIDIMPKKLYRHNVKLYSTQDSRYYELYITIYNYSNTKLTKDTVFNYTEATFSVSGFAKASSSTIPIYSVTRGGNNDILYLWYGEDACYMPKESRFVVSDNVQKIE